jgi:hypothetical protein
VWPIRNRKAKLGRIWLDCRGCISVERSAKHAPSLVKTLGIGLVDADRISQGRE